MEYIYSHLHENSKDACIPIFLSGAVLGVILILRFFSFLFRGKNGYELLGVLPTKLCLDMSVLE